MKLFNRDKTSKTSNSEKGFIERARDLQNDLEARRSRIGRGKYGRVLKMARKPTNEEYIKTSKITGAGMLLIGGLGFAIYLIVTELVPWIAETLGLI